MNWIKKVVLKENDISSSEDIVDERRDIKIETIHHANNSGSTFTPISQYFLSENAETPDVFTYISIPTVDFFNQTMREVALHFEFVELVLNNEKVVEVRLNKPMKESIELLKTTKTNAIIAGLFEREGDNEQLHPYQAKNKTLYEMDCSVIENVDDHDFNAVFEYVCLASQSKEEKIFFPKNWMLDDSLKHSSAIRYFANHPKTKALYVLVNDDTNVVLQMIVK